MQRKSNAYSSILKGTALFGGVQVFNILINLVRGKLVALLLGPEGMGISSLLTSSMNTIQQFTGLGLNLSSVQEIAKAHGQQDAERIGFVAYTLRRLLHLTALAGSLFAILFCSHLSEWTFGNADYKWHFALLSIVIFFSTLSGGELSILQGIHAVKKLAFASVIGSTIGLVVGIPLYYFLGYNGIVPAMIALPLAIYIFFRYHTNRLVNVSNVTYQWKTMYPLAKRMVSLGIVMMISSLLGTLTQYIMNSYIGRTGSLEDVGLFQAANSITNQYIGLVFAAMGADFAPRLSAISHDNGKVRQLVNQQTEIVVLLTVPLAMLLIMTAPLLIRILLTKEFLEVTPIICWMGLGVALKAIAYPMGYISFAKGDKKTFFWLEGIWGNILLLIANLSFYTLWGVYGLGMSFVFLYFIGCMTYVFLTFRLYEFKHSPQTLLLIAKSLTFLVILFLINLFSSSVYAYVLESVLFVLTCIFCLSELNKRIDLWNTIRDKIKHHHAK